MDRDTILRLAREADLWMTSDERIAAAKRFAALIETHLKERGYRQCAKGQRTTQFCGMLQEAVKAERESCAKVCEGINDGTPYNLAAECAAAIRSRT